MPVTPLRRNPRIRPAAAAGFLLVHLAALGVFWVGLSWKGVALCLASYYLRMFAITAGFHRYFSHRTYRLGRVPQFLLAFLGQTSAQKGVLWWASNHRHHHKYSDRPEDLHSPTQRGFWWSHMGWILAEDYEETNLSRIPDLVKFPELLWLDRNMYLPTMLYGLALFLAFGPTGLFWGYFLSTVLLWHGTFTINSVMHVWGRKVFPTTDTSRNSFLLALLTMGEGWHNNHHFYPGSAAQGFRWWQVDPSFYLLWAGEKAGIVRSLRRVPAHLKAASAAAEATRARLEESMREKVDALSARWAAEIAAAQKGAQEKFVEMDAARARAAARLEELQADYAAARQRAGDAASRRIDELQAEIEGARLQLAQLLEEMIERAESMGLVPSEAGTL